MKVPMYNVNVHSLQVCLCYALPHTTHYTLLFGKTSIYFATLQVFRLTQSHKWRCMYTFSGEAKLPALASALRRPIRRSKSDS